MSGQVLRHEAQHTVHVLRESSKVSSQSFGEPPGGLPVLGPTEYLIYRFCYPPSAEPLSSHQHPRAGPLDGLHV